MSEAGLKLLVVEDEARMVQLLRRGLTEEGHTVVCAGDGQEGLDLARNYEFDVIILDIMMPKLSGYELAQRLRSERVATPVLMLTAKDSVPDVVRGLDAGADDYLTKPFAFEELLARLRGRGGCEWRRRCSGRSAGIPHRTSLACRCTRGVLRSGRPRRGRSAST